MPTFTGDEFNNYLEGTNGVDVIRGLEGNDELVGLDGNDRLFGGPGDDSIYDGNGDDEVDAGPGRDWSYYSAGNDTIDGGDDFDRIDYGLAPGGIVADLQAGTISDGGGGIDTVRNVERIIGSAFDDVLEGTDGRNSFSGEGGNDLIDGRGDFDFVWYGRSPGGIDVDLASGAVTGAEGNDTLMSIEGLGATNYDDTIRGSDADEYFTLDQDGDIYTPNYLVGGNDYLDGRGGIDMVDYNNATNPVTVDLGQQTATDGLGNTDTLISIEIVRGSTFGDMLTGSGGAEELRGGSGNDTLEALAGNDTLSDGPGDDVSNGGAGDDVFILGLEGGMDMLDGGDGIDTLILPLEGITGAVPSFVDLIAGEVGAIGFPNGRDTVMNIENVTIEGDVDVAFTGDGMNNLLTGSGGDDTLIGGDGDDTLLPGAGVDEVDGGAGIDMVSYVGATRSVRVDLQNPALNYNDAAGDTFTDVEVFRTGAGIDQLRGDASGNVFYTGEVSDRLYGRAGDDTLFGETGADAFYGGLGADVMTGGDDAGRRDRFIYFNAAETGVGAGNRDVITDFVPGEDRIELSRIDADLTQGFKQRFDFIGDAAFSGTGGELRFEQQGGITLVQADRDGDGVADMEIELTGTLTLTATDFLI
ncbi:calcium-binding protein [Pseudaestuariivita atlantica]|uniref:Peptidase M10 serralysin C-terminal domain-containing protein n=1 Tax=Pseudaestuariivita atlantica TaxID=1317121 RepID=A0A0L1JME1_9RHOB|nr:calcium-binding protein [Pseudaestuariivita atlantica]KNG92920.1 hypothetical protein ATO11_15850 [Pseudaestuariivita atlantica]